MANPADGSVPSGRNFKPVRTSYDIHTGNRSKVEGGIVHPSGRTLLNVKGTEIADSLALEAGLNLERYNVTFQADQENSLVAVYVTSEVGPGVMPARRSTDGRSVTIHLGGVFKENPKMRPVGKRDCQVWREVDPAGQPYMVISLGTALGTRTTTRTETE